MQYYLKHKDLADFISELRKQYSVIAPFMDNDSLLYRVAQEEEYPDFSRLPENSLREFFQPKTHYYLTFQPHNLTDVSFADFDASPRIIAGVRPCDIRGIHLLSLALGESTSFKKLRQHTLIFGLLCNTPENTCFCQSLGVDPQGTKGMDVALNPLKQGYNINPISERGKHIVKKLSMLQKKSSSFRKTKLPPQKRSLNVEGLAERIGENVDSPLFEDLSFSCIHCRICTYHCPTCHCFTITDETLGEKGARAMVWDSCQSPSFTKEASGHNPRLSEASRIKQRLLHKFLYFLEQYGEYGCTGCGRCIRLCPMGRDITEEIRDLG